MESVILEEATARGCCEKVKAYGPLNSNLWDMVVKYGVTGNVELKLMGFGWKYRCYSYRVEVVLAGSDLEDEWLTVVDG
ncbi:hypothetical protein Peur_028102 [Populus x canadensis]